MIILASMKKSLTEGSGGDPLIGLTQVLEEDGRQDEGGEDAPRPAISIPLASFAGNIPEKIVVNNELNTIC